MSLLLRLILLCRVGSIVLSSLSAGSSSPRTVGIESLSTASAPVIDEQLYSRQMLVYGAGAQQSLAQASVLVYGNGPLAAEIVKNLALAGVGHLSVVDDDTSAALKLKGSTPTLSAYARELNPHIKVSSVSMDEADLASQHYSVVVATDVSLHSLIRINAECRRIGSKLVGCDVAGVCGFVFDDFLERVSCTINTDGAGVEVPVASVEQVLIESDQQRLVRVRSIEEEQFLLGLGDELLLVAPKHSPLPARVVGVDSTRSVLLAIHDGANIDSILSSSTLATRKVPSQASVDHRPLGTYLSSDAHPISFNACNGCLSDRQNRALSITLAAAFLTLSEEKETIPKTSSVNRKGWPNEQRDVSSFSRAISRHIVSLGVPNPQQSVKQGGVGDYLASVGTRFFHSRRGRCPATVSVVGAIASQETIKAITGVHAPLQQMIFFESLDSLPSKLMQSKSNQLQTTDMHKVYGSLANDVQSLRVFVVGAGAIGCELLKNFALMGVGCPIGDDIASPIKEGLWAEKGLGGGGVVVADMDSIEKSNLNRQLLFRPQHIGASKAETAASFIKTINPRMRIWGINSKVGPTTSLFDQSFWSDASLVATALDNVEARRFVDSECVRHKRCLLDSGTQGTKGNTQVIYPNVTETYSSSADPADNSIPLCTLKSFPYQAEHCVAWAKVMFDDVFNTDVSIMEKFLKTKNDKAKILQDLDSLSEEELQRFGANTHVLRNGVTYAASLDWAIGLFRYLYHDEIVRILQLHPHDCLDEQGGRFWGGSRRTPVPLDFDKRNEDHKNFVVWAATLRCRSLGKSGEYVGKGEVDALLSRKRSATSNVNQDRNEIAASVLELRKNLSYPFLSQTYEKDDPTLGHVDWVSAAANLRCTVYGINKVDRLEVQRISGNIIPALATTTALVSGLVCLELMKVAAHSGNGVKEDVLRNSFINLALPVLSFAQPMSADAYTVGGEGVYDISVNEIRIHLLHTYGVHLQTLSWNDALLYADFISDSEDRLDLPLFNLLSLGEPDPDSDDDGFIDDRAVHISGFLPSIPSSGFLELTVTCVNDDEEDIKFPILRLSVLKSCSRRRSWADKLITKYYSTAKEKAIKIIEKLRLHFKKI